MFRLLFFIENKLYRDGLVQLLECEKGIETTAACSTVDDLQHHLDNTSADIILIDTAIPNALPAITLAYCHPSQYPIVALGLDESDEQLLIFAQAGASAFVTKNQSVADLLECVRSASAGKLSCSPRTTRLLQERLASLSASTTKLNNVYKLSNREYEILELVAMQMTNKQIARRLFLEVCTIKNHVHNIIVKLSVNNRSEAAEMLRSNNQATNSPLINTAKSSG